MRPRLVFFKGRTIKFSDPMCYFSDKNRPICESEA